MSKNIKRIIALIMTAIFCTAFVACGDDGKAQEEPQPTGPNGVYSSVFLCNMIFSDGKVVLNYPSFSDGEFDDGVLTGSFTVDGDKVIITLDKSISSKFELTTLVYLYNPEKESLMFSSDDMSDEAKEHVKSLIWLSSFQKRDE